MISTMKGCVLVLLLSLWAGAEVDAINQQVLADVIQQMRRFGLENHQYAMAVRLTQQQCTRNGVPFNVGVTPQVVQNRLTSHRVYIGERLIAAIPDTFHAEYLLLGHDNINPSRISTLLNAANRNRECIVFFSNYSPCLEHCNVVGGAHSILPFLPVFNGWSRERIAFVFSSVWEPARHHPGQINPPGWQVLQSFGRIDPFIPLFRCVRFGNVNQCYPCVTPGATPGTNDCLFGYPNL